MDYSLAIHIISTLPIELYCIAQLYKKATTIYFEESIILEYFECIEKSLTFHVDCFSVNTKTIVGVHCITNLYNCFYIRYITSYISVELKHVLLSKFFLTLTIYLHSTLNHNLTYMSTLLFNKKVVYSYKLNYLTLENTTTLVANIFIKNINNALVFKYFFLNSILFSILFYNTIAHSFRYIHTSTILLSLLFISKKCTSINAYTFIRSTYTNLVTSIFYCKQFVYTTAYKY